MRTARHIGIQTLYVLSGNLFTLAVGLPLQIYVARVLGANGLGLFGLMESVIATATGFLGFGIGQTTVRFVASHIENREFGHVRRLLKLGTVVLVSAGVVGLAALLAGTRGISRFWPDLAGHSTVLALMGLTLPLGLLLHFLQQALRGLQDIRYLIFGSSILQLTVKATATVVAFAVGWGVEGYVLAIVLANLVAVTWMALGLKRKVGGLPHDTADGGETAMRSWRRYATICYSRSLLEVWAVRLDRFVLAAAAGSGAVGVLLVVRQLQQLPQMFNQMLLMVGAPMFAAAHSRNDRAYREHLYALMTDWVVKASLPLILFLLIFTQPLLALFGPEFAAKGGLALWIFVLGQAFGLSCGPVGNIALMSGLEARHLRISVVGTCITAALVVALTIPFGLLGVAIAAASGTVFSNAAMLYVVHRHLQLRWWNRRYLGWLAPAVATCATGAAVAYADIPLGAFMLAATLVTMYAAFAVVLLLQGLNEDDRDLLQHLTNRLLGRASEA